MELNGVAALVSGGASGLGEATVRELTAAGATVVIADVNTERGEALAKEVGGVFVRTDVADEDQVQAAVQAAVDTGKPLRAAVSCAGIAWAARTVARDGTPHDLASFRKIIDVNLIGTFNVVRLAAAAMAKTEPINDDGERGAMIAIAAAPARSRRVRGVILPTAGSPFGEHASAEAWGDEKRRVRSRMEGENFSGARRRFRKSSFTVRHFCGADHHKAGGGEKSMYRYRK